MLHAGRAYLEEQRDVESDRWLERLLDGYEPTTPLVEFLERRVRDDFAAGRTVLIDYWIVSETEARIYGAVALFSGA